MLHKYYYFFAWYIKYLPKHTGMTARTALQDKYGNDQQRYIKHTFPYIHKKNII
jgi:hypothetical protein